MPATTSKNTNPITISETDVRKEIIKDLKEWGVDQTHNDEHKAFWHRAVTQAVKGTKQDFSSAVSVEQLFSKATELSKEPKVAVLQVLHNELEDSEDFTFLDATDSLEFDFKPYYHSFDKRTRSNVLRKRFELKKYKSNDLDPFRRFEGIEYSAEDWFRMIWQTTSLEGYVFEALVASHMICHMQCKSCKFRNQLFWNGGIDASGSWADVVCRRCRASYEIKSVASDDAVEKKIKFNSFRGGSFRQYYKNPAHFQTRYLVIVSRKETYIKKLNLVHRVSIAKIRRVEPRLCAESFLDTGSSFMRMISNIKIETGSIEKAWCYVQPIKGHAAIAQEVFDDYFGDGAWSRTSTIRENENTEDENEVELGLQNPTENDEEEGVEQLRENLKALQVDDDVDGD
jgi:hypothetical protein